MDNIVITVFNFAQCIAIIVIELLMLYTFYKTIPELPKMITDGMSGDNGHYSSKKLSMFWCLMLGSFLILLEVFSHGGFKPDHSIIYMLFVSAGLMPIMGMTDKKLNDSAIIPDKTITTVNVIKTETIPEPNTQ